jgi:hypothetical protein
MSVVPYIIDNTGGLPIMMVSPDKCFPKNAEAASVNKEGASLDQL